MSRARQMTVDLAETVAIQALTFIAGEPDQLGRFLALSGIGPDSLRAAAAQPHFLLGVLDHLAADDALLREFADQSKIDPETVLAAQRILAGQSSAGT
jgi:hypothetical protein